jgi:protein-disulfide isomerase
MSPVEEDQEDLTRKERREQARTQRKAVEEAEVASAARKRRLGQLGIVAAVVIVAIVVILIATGGGGSSGPTTTGKSSEEAVAAVNASIGGIPQSGNTIGNPSAPVTIQYFGDLECPVCREFTLGALPTIMQQWVKTGKVKIEYLALETATREPEVFKTQQVAALAAGKQNLMWNYIELFYHQQGEEGSGYVTDAYLQGLAKQIPALNQTKWMSARNESALSSRVEADGQAAASQGFNGTPAFMIGKTGGAMQKLEHYSLTDPTPFNEAIEKLLKG